jgi:O-methyltransferase
LVATINRLMEQDVERVATIDRLTALINGRGATSPHDAERVATIERLIEQDVQRVATIDRLMTSVPALTARLEELTEETNAQAWRLVENDGITVIGRNRAFLEEPAFAAAWEEVAKLGIEGWPQGTPDIRWRAHVAVWCARQALMQPGAFVECGVHVGLLSMMICRMLDFAQLDRRFYLFDTFRGIPIDGVMAEERERISSANTHYYKDMLAVASRNFAAYPNVELMPGILPASLEALPDGRIAYLSVDLNNVQAERGVIEALWDRIVPGGVILIDDYDWSGCEAQRDMWDVFMSSRGHAILCLPTGQGVVLRHGP